MINTKQYQDTIEANRILYLDLDCLENSLHEIMGGKTSQFVGIIHPDTEFTWNGATLQAVDWAVMLGLSLVSFRWRVRTWGICEKTFSGKKGS